MWHFPIDKEIALSIRLGVDEETAKAGGVQSSVVNVCGLRGAGGEARCQGRQGHGIKAMEHLPSMKNESRDVTRKRYVAPVIGMFFFQYLCRPPNPPPPVFMLLPNLAPLN
jgi:hypothetical protein